MATDPVTSSPVSSKQTRETPGPEEVCSPNKHPRKTLTVISSRPISSPSSPSFKGKDKIGDYGSTTVDSEPDWESNSCGICLSAEGKAVRGWIDSCEHYFCFICIMEWAKIESRCPMCKRRFGTICRPPKAGIFALERVVNVPVRDQVHNGLGNATIGPPDPYSEVHCTVCKSETNENLLLLCDLCDSAAHTYCVGLGATIPEGDWFCQDCSVSRDEHSNAEMDSNSDGQAGSIIFHKMPQAEEDVSIFDIVHEPILRVVQRNSAPASLQSNRLLSPVSCDTKTLAGDNPEQGSRTNPNVYSTATGGLGARTLRQCRNVHGRIQVLRENWNALRTGSLRFSSSMARCDGKTNQRFKSDARLSGKSGETLMPCSSPVLITHTGSYSNILTDRSSSDVNKAWKMMDVAKSIGQPRSRMSTVGQVSRLPSGNKASSPIKKTNAISSPLLLHTKSFDKFSENTGPQNNFQYYLQLKGNNGHMCQIVKEQKQGHSTSKMTSRFGESSQGPETPGCSKLPSSKIIRSCDQVNGRHRKVEKLLEENIPSSSDAFNEHDGSTCLIFPAGSEPEPSSSSCAMPDSNMELPNGKAGADDGAKSEIRSLVKLNLKLLSKDKKLGINAFKEIARLATHSILAACGLEYPSPGVPSFPSSICCHGDLLERLRKSTLMPSSCRECFYIFVKDVVNTIMSERMNYVQTRH